MSRGVLIGCLGLAGCAGVQTPLAPAAVQSQQLLTLLWVMVAVCALAYASVLAFLGSSLWRSRGRSAAGAPDIIADGRGLTRAFWAWGTFVLVGLILLGAASFLTDWSLARAERRGDLEVRVTGHQWWWRIQYRDPLTGGWIETANELHLPLGRTTRILVGSGDVIHSFWIPNLTGKKDMIPGRANMLAVTPHRTGWFRGQCAEFCGAQHANMALDARVEAAGAFDAWLAAQAAPAGRDPATARGMRIVTQGPCAACHSVRGTPATGRAGPDLTHVASRRSLAAGTVATSRGALQGWILQPRAIKPGTSMPPIPLSGPDADAVSLYLMALK